MSALIHARHEQALSALKRASLAMPANQKYIVIVYDGPDVAPHDRLASYASDAPPGDVKLICEAMAKQIDEHG